MIAQRMLPSLRGNLMRFAGLCLLCVSLVQATLIETPMSLLSNTRTPLDPQPQRMTGYFELNTTHAGSMFYWYGTACADRVLHVDTMRCPPRAYRAASSHRARTSCRIITRLFRFFESRRMQADDPVVLWIHGMHWGVGC